MNPDPKTIIEELKAAGEELKKTSPAKFSESEEKHPSSFTPLSDKTLVGKEAIEGREEVDLLKKIDKYQQKIAQEQSALEKAYQEVKELEKKLEGRIELLKKLQTKSKEFQGELSVVQKENSDILEQIKNKLNSNLLSSYGQ